MKVAVLISGMYREFEIAFQSWDFLKLIDHDIYFSTWSTTDESNEALGIEINEEVTMQRIDKLVKPVRYCIEPLSVFSAHSTLRMMHRWKRGLNMIKYSGIQYDAVLIIRPDLFIDGNPQQLAETLGNLNDGTFYVPGGVFDYDHLQSGEIRSGICDMALAGTPKMMFKLLDIPTMNTPMPSDIHQYLADWFAERGDIEGILGLGKICIVRGSCRQLSEFTFTTVNDAETLWYNTKYK